jgi:hypothetical protein
MNANLIEFRACRGPGRGRDEAETRRIAEIQRRHVLAATLVAFLAIAGGAAAQDGKATHLDVSYLAAPTDWCPANAGIPMVINMDGPDIIKGPDEFPRAVRVRRGSQVTDFSGENTASMNPVEDFSGPNAELIGRFTADFRTCFDPFGYVRATGSWRLTAPDGSNAGSGAFENEQISHLYFPFFRGVAGPSRAYYAEFGDRWLFTAAQPQITTNQMFLAEPDKE